MAFFLIVLLLQLTNSFYIANETCHPIDKCQYSQKTQLKIFAKGLIKEDADFIYHMHYLYCLNYYFECGYMLKEFENKQIKQNGVYFGLGINLSLLDDVFYKQFQKDSNIVIQLHKFNNKIAAEAYDLMQSNPIQLTKEEIDDFNIKALDYLFEQVKNTYKLGEYSDVMFISMPLLSLYLKNEDLYPIVKGYSEARAFEQVMYSIENLPGGDVFERKKQSMLINSMLKTCDENHYVNFLVDRTFTEKNWEFIQLIIQDTTSALSSNYFAITFYDKEGTNELMFTANSNEIKSALLAIKYQSIPESHLLIGLSSIEANFNNIPKSEFEIEKILVIFINSLQSDESYRERIEKKISELNSFSGVKVIFIGKEEGEVNRANLEKLIHRQDNIFLFKDQLTGVFYQKMNIRSLIASICLQHTEISLIKEKKFLSGKYKISSYSSVDYFLIHCNPDTKYIIELWIKQEDYNGINLYCSKTDPYPDVNSHYIKHLGLRRDKEPPKIVISSGDSNEIYLSVMSNFLVYSLEITEANDLQEDDGSNGYFTNHKINHYNDIQSFYNCHSYRCYLKDVPLLKYYARGIHPNENIEPYSYDSDLFHCLIPVYTCGYYKNPYHNEYDKTAGVYIGQDISLKKLTNNQLMIQYKFPKLLINKMHRFLKKYRKETEQSQSDALESENLNFTWNETELIYDNAIGVQISALKKDFQVLQGILLFNEVHENIRFLLLSRRFLKQYATSAEDIIDISSENYKGYLNNVTKIQDSSFQLMKNFNILLFQATFFAPKEKALILLIIGQSYLFSVDEKELIQFIDELSLNNRKLSLTVYDKNKNTLNTIFDFKNKTAEIREDILYYKQNHPYIKQSNNEKNGSYDKKIISQIAINRFKTYDKGVKKILLVIENKDEINNKVNDKFNETILENEGINTLLLTSLSQQSHTLEAIAPVKKENIIHEFNITNESSCQMVIKAIRFTIIPLRTTYKINTDFYKESPLFFELIRQEETKIEQVIYLNSDNLIIYTSKTFPYPSIYSKDKEYIGEKEIKIELNETEKLFISIVPKEGDAKRVNIELYSCDEEACSQIKHSSLLICFIILSGLALVGYAIYSFYSDLKKEKRKTNIFE